MARFSAECPTCGRYIPAYPTNLADEKSGNFTITHHFSPGTEVACPATGSKVRLEEQDLADFLSDLEDERRHDLETFGPPDDARDSSITPWWAEA